MLRFAIDRGGTFTDIYAQYGGKIYTEKLLSSDPAHYDDAAVEGIGRVLKRIFPDIDEISARRKIEWIRMGTTVATNALLQRRGAVTALVATEGLGDVLDIGYQNRPDIFALNIEKPERIVDRRVEIAERVVPGEEAFDILKRPDRESLGREFRKLAKEGIESLAIVFAHSYAYEEHERMAAEVARECGFENISVSHTVSPSIRYTDRAETTAVDAYLTPVIREYIERFEESFATSAESVKLLFMQSSGGLTEARRFRGSNAILSGPAGGVVGYAKSFYRGRALIGFDMGGTSTDVSRFAGDYEISYENEIDGIRVKAPQIEISTVASGGGSRLFYRNSMFVVGPESSGAHPGPLCYRKGGFLSLTDANLFLGRIIPRYFPAIFGENADMPLDREASEAGLRDICEEINADFKKRALAPLSVEEVAMGFIEVANESMMKPIRELAAAKGFDPSEHELVCFGGAGGQHACAIASILGIEKIHIHRYSGILSAFGLGMAEIRSERERSLERRLETIEEELDGIFEKLRTEILQEMDYRQEEVTHRRFLRLGYDGSDTSIEIEEPEDGEWKEAFERVYERRFGFLPQRDIVAMSAISRVTISTPSMPREEMEASRSKAKPDSFERVYFDGEWIDTPVYILEELGAGAQVDGPAIVLNGTSTIVVEPFCSLETDRYGDMLIRVGRGKKSRSPKKGFDPVRLALYNSIFSSIAERMGRILRKTAVSTNIRERLDFSCAIFDADGNLVSNAPHIPVHLGSMEYFVKALKKKFGTSVENGDIFIGNAPAEGGSHLPDITLCKAVFDSCGNLLCWLAARGHHADIGGSTPGSMPPFSVSIEEEGALIESFKIVRRGVFAEREILDILNRAGARKIADNISDIEAQIASLLEGESLMEELVAERGVEETVAYMAHIQSSSEEAARKFLSKYAGRAMSAGEYLDDGTLLSLRVEISENGDALFDFRGSSPQQLGSQNLPPAVTASAIVYCIRVLTGEDMALNGGLLRPIELLFEEGSILSPYADAAVVGGNVTTSQRVVDLILKIFGVSAASCGCMNNLIFGNDKFGYYETIGGGAGAVEGSDGADAVHTHMTNTRITDVEILERRYPVILRRFSIRRGSGGEGRYRGGDGIVREMEFLENMKLSLLTERRVFAPWGAAGGGDGKRGENLLLRKGRSYRLPSKVSIGISAGDILRIETPGGGGYGAGG
jgi:5-oxoprolinase (ATP-hydrolysing)